jgi:hypothetical protein
LREIAFEGAPEPVQQPGLVIDQLPSVLDEQLQGMSLLVLREPGSELIPMLPKEFQGQPCIRGIIAGATGCKGALDRVGAGTVGGQQEQGKPRVARQLLFHSLGLGYIVIDHHREPRVALGWIVRIDAGEQVPKQRVGCARPVRGAVSRSLRARRSTRSRSLSLATSVACFYT